MYVDHVPIIVKIVCKTILFVLHVKMDIPEIEILKIVVNVKIPRVYSTKLMTHVFVQSVFRQSLAI